MDSTWRKVLLVCRAVGGDVIPDVTVTREDQVPVREDLLELFQVSELEKYFTEEEHYQEVVEIHADLKSIVRAQFPRTQNLEYAILKAHLIIEYSITQYVRSA